MIFDEDDVNLNILSKGNLHEHLKLSEVEEFLSAYKKSGDYLKPKEMMKIEDTLMYFSDDEDKNIFYAYVYKTSQKTDRWILFMKDEVEGYALYENPQTERMQLAWYHRKLTKPLSPDEEKNLVTCYQPSKKQKDN